MSKHPERPEPAPNRAHDKLDAGDRHDGGDRLDTGDRHDPHDSHDADEQRHRSIAFVVRLARALHSYGTPAHRLEEALSHVADRLQLEGQFFSTPTSVFAAFGRPGAQEMALQRIDPGDVDLEKVSELDELLDHVATGRVTPAEADRALDQILARPTRRGRWISMLGFALVSASAATFFGGGWKDVGISAAVGLLVGVISNLVARLHGGNRIVELAAAAFATFCATAIAAQTGWVSVIVVTLSALIVLLPGLNFTVSISELASRHLVAGSSRFAGSLLIFITLAFGAALGKALAERIFGAPAPYMPEPLSAWVHPLALFVSGVGLLITLRARPRDLPWILLAGSGAFLAGRWGVQVLGQELGSFSAAVVVGAGSNLFARLRRRPAIIMAVPGLILLVPGSIGFRGVTALVAHETVAGVQTAFSVLLVAVALATGLLVANTLIPPRRSL